MKLAASGYRIGQYKTSMRILATNVQAANSRIFELRNANVANLVIPLSLQMRALQLAAGTAQENALRAYKLTAITAVDTVNTVTPTVTKARTTMAAPGAVLRHLTIAGAAAGMTGGTLTKDTNPIAIMPYNVAAAINVTTLVGAVEAFPETDDQLPLILAPDEGLLVESDILNVTSFGMGWYLDFTWAEVTNYIN